MKDSLLMFMKLLCYQCRLQAVHHVLLYAGEVTWRLKLKREVGIRNVDVQVQEKSKKKKAFCIKLAINKY